MVSIEPGTRLRHVENMLPSADLPAVMALEKVKIKILIFWQKIFCDESIALLGCILRARSIIWNVNLREAREVERDIQ